MFGMLGLLFGIALAGSSVSDGESYAHIADAAAQIQDALVGFGCTPHKAYRDRAIARLTMAEQLPGPVVELSYTRVLPLFATDACTKQALDPPEGATAYRVPEVPECAREGAESEIARAGWLADRGFEEAANAVAGLATRWDRTRCPGRRALLRRDLAVASGMEDPKWCSCGGQRARPSDVWFGWGASVDELRFELDLARSDATAMSAPYGHCPTGCVTTDWYRPDQASRPASGRLNNTMVETDSRAVEVVHEAGAGVNRPMLNDVVAQLPPGCHGTAEWLGAWMPYDPQSSCLVDVLNATDWKPGAWVILDT